MRSINFLLIALAVITASTAVDAADIEATRLGAFPIPDNDPAGLDLVFSFAGTNLEVAGVILDLDIEHTWTGDLTATLTAPDGAAQMVIFSRVGVGRDNDFGDSSNLAGLYTFADIGTSFWAASAGPGDDDIVPPGIFRTSTAGQPGLSNYGGLNTSLAGAFGNLLSGSRGIPIDGDWTLNVTDLAAQDTGVVNAATLTFIPEDDIFMDGFEFTVPPPVRTTQGPAPLPLPRNRFDLDGNGLADFSVLIDNEGDLEWSILANIGAGATGAETTFILGDASTDFWNAADFDGDGISDAATWNNMTHVYSIRRSSRPNTAPVAISIGGTGDNPTVVGDYDGDGIDDPATFASMGPGQPMTLRYVRSSDGVTATVPLGVASSLIRPLGGQDFNGDGRADLLLFSDGVITVRDGQSGAAIDTFTFGSSADALLFVGNYAGDNRADVTRTFIDGTDVVWQTRVTGPGTILPQVTLGTIGMAGFSEFAAAADYDGDGYIDYAVWRRDNSSNDSAQFIVRPSTDPANLINVTQGSMGDATLPGAQAN